MAKIGFIGLGIMGAPMAGHLIDGGHTLYTSTHRSPAPKALTDKGLEVVGSPKEVARRPTSSSPSCPTRRRWRKVLFGETASPKGCRRARRSST
jgi:2-hydroxy-3-oxopropionate reductase